MYYRTPWECYAGIYKRHGVVGFYRGLVGGFAGAGVRVCSVRCAGAGAWVRV